MDILTAKGLVKYYGKGESLVKAVDHTSFSVEKGEFTAIVGTSAFCGARRTPMRFRADAVRSITDALNRLL